MVLADASGARTARCIESPLQVSLPHMRRAVGDGKIGAYRMSTASNRMRQLKIDQAAGPEDQPGHRLRLEWRIAELERLLAQARTGLRVALREIDKLEPSSRRLGLHYILGE